MRDHAVVCGGSIAGLLAARVLSEHYTSVTVVERDRLPAHAQHRRGVPHDRHFHGLLPHGQQLIERLFPGITRGLIADGALAGDILAHIRWYVRGRMLRQADTGLTMLSASRPLIEAALRNRVGTLPNVRLRDGRQVTGLCTTPDRRRVTGVRVAGLAGEGTQSLPANLVIDASGRSALTRRWVSELGYPDPPVTSVNIGLRYVSCTFTAPPAAFGTDIMVAIAPARRGGHSGVMQRIEGNRVLVTLAGIHGDRPPLDADGFADYASTLSAPDIHHLIQYGTAVTRSAQFHCPTYERHHYELLPDFPAGLLPIGDVICSFNPVYSEGISAAARSAVALRDQLQRCDQPVAAEYFRHVSAILDEPWDLAVSADLAAADNTPRAQPTSPLTADYRARLERAAADDAYLSTAYVRVATLVDPPLALLSPAIQQRLASAAGAPGRAEGDTVT